MHQKHIHIEKDRDKVDDFFVVELSDLFEDQKFSKTLTRFYICDIKNGLHNIIVLSNIAT